MIEEITITNLGVIEKASLNLHSRMTALTGETGAGKTMALTSLYLLMGGKADISKIRAGADRAVVEGIFTLPLSSPALEIVQNAGGNIDVVAERATLVIARHLLREGRSRAYLGGVSVPISLLRELSTYLFTVHGQADQLRLKSKQQHLQALDDFAELAQNDVYRTYKNDWEAYQVAVLELETAKVNAENLGTEKLALRAFLQRVAEVEPEVAEDDELRIELARLENLENFRVGVLNALDALNGSEQQNGAIDLLAQASKELRHTADSDLQNLVADLEEAQNLSAEVTNQLAHSLGQLVADPERIDKIHERRAQLNALQRELGMDISAILEKVVQAKARLQKLADPQQYLQNLQQRADTAYTKLRASGEQVSVLRLAAGDKLSARVTAELQALAMKDAEFKVCFKPLAEPSANGLDEVEFYLCPHRGATFTPLAETASGGEISRIMLALEVTLAKNTLTEHTFIFDEIDAGIGGNTALSVGKRLAQLAVGAQVLVVTHLAQVAAYANSHIVVSKSSNELTTITDVYAVTEQKREKELARMLSGQEDLPVARAHAAELLNNVDITG